MQGRLGNAGSDAADRLFNPGQADPAAVAMLVEFSIYPARAFEAAAGLVLSNGKDPMAPPHALPRLLKACNRPSGDPERSQPDSEVMQCLGLVPRAGAAFNTRRKRTVWG
jgi:hypothetical protein